MEVAPSTTSDRCLPGDLDGLRATAPLSIAVSMKRFQIALGALLLAVACQSDGGVEFHELTIDQALQRADVEDKLVFIDFFTTWCVPCREMDATTFQDPEVGAWLAEHTVALKVDAEANETNEALAKRFGVRSYPNYVFVSPEGDLLDRLGGKRASAPFLAFGASVLRGENAIGRAKKALEEEGTNDPDLRMDLARAYAELGHDEAALREYLWCFDEGAKQDSSYTGVRVSFWLSEIAEFARHYPPAMDALDERRSAAQARILDGTAEYEDVSVYTSINQWLATEEATLSLYDQVKREGRLSGIALFGFEEDVVRLLVDAKEYGRVVEEFDIPARVARAFEQFEASVFTDEELAEMDDALQAPVEELARTAGPTFLEDTLKDLLRRGVASSYEVLLGARRDEDAARLAERLINTLDDAETRRALAWAGYLTGDPAEANLTQAHEAFDMTGGDDIEVVDTLARVLATYGYRDEAIEVAQAGLDKAATELERHTMSACLRYCLQSPQRVESPTTRQ